MSKFINCSHNYLYKKGIVPIIVLFYFGISGYVIFLLLHQVIVTNYNTIVIIFWGIFTLVLTIYWYKKTNQMLNDIERYTLGWIGEHKISKKLKKLLENDDFYIFYDVKFKDINGNIDFIVVCRGGVFVIESKASTYIFKNRWLEDKKLQAKWEAKCLQNILFNNNINIKWVKPILVFPSQKEFKGNFLNDDEIEILGGNQILAFFSDKRLNNIYESETVERIAEKIKEMKI